MEYWRRTALSRFVVVSRFYFHVISVLALRESWSSRLPLLSFRPLLWMLVALQSTMTEFSTWRPQSLLLYNINVINLPFFSLKCWTQTLIDDAPTNSHGWYDVLQDLWTMDTACLLWIRTLLGFLSAGFCRRMFYHDLQYNNYNRGATTMSACSDSDDESYGSIGRPSSMPSNLLLDQDASFWIGNENVYKSRDANGKAFVIRASLFLILDTIRGCSCK